jgi:hypothetical protein
MTIETNLNVSPYFDDIDNALSSNYHRILFRPAIPVQARELTQLQDILQNQIERFGDNIFVTGSIIKGCNFSFDSNYHYAKILDLRPVDSQPTQPSSYVGLLGYEATSNLYAICYNSQDGFESQAPNLKTLYFKYLNTGISGQSTFSPGSQITFYQANEIASANSTTAFANADVKIASGTDAIGRGYAMSVSSGVLFQKGHFIQVPTNDTVIVSKYSQYPNNVVAGFMINENIVTYNQDQNLLDNATGYSNFSAPGADRLQLSPDLVAYDIDDAPSNNFFSLVEWQNGNIVRSFQETQYSLIGNEMARRTLETSGNFVVKPFRVSMQDANSTHNFAVISAGLAYIDGHRVEQLNNVYVPVRKGTDKKVSSDQKLQTSYDNSVLVGEYTGSFPTNVMTTISLRDTSTNRISNGQYSNTVPAGSEIGVAKVLGLQYFAGTIGEPDCVWKLFLTDVDMNLGKNFRDVKSVFSNASINGVYGGADIVRTLDAVSNTYVSALQNTSRAPLVFPTGKTGQINFTETSNLPKYVYRTISNTTIIGSTGNSSLIELTGATFPYGKGELTTNELTSIVVVPTAIAGGANSANVTLTKSGLAQTTVGSANITSTAGAFSTEYEIGDFIATHNTNNTGVFTRRIISIANNTFMTVDRVYAAGEQHTGAGSTHNKTYPINVPINIQQRKTRVTVTDTAEQHMNIQLVASNGVNETLSGDVSVSVHHNALLTNVTDRNLLISNNIHVLINTSNNSGGVAGPWCLGIPYAFRIQNVYKSSNTGTLIGNTVSASTTLTGDTTGFANGVVIFGPGIVPGTTANVASPTTFTLSTAATLTNNFSTFKWSYYSNNSVDDVTSSFFLQDGQTDTLFEHSYVAFNPKNINTAIANGDLLTIVFDAFKPQNDDTGYISIDSYSTMIGSNNLSYESIPSYINKNNNEMFLRDSVDFRQFVSNTAVYSNTISGASVNPQFLSVPANIVNNPPITNTELYIVAPDQHFQYDSYNYLSRIDKLIINSFGKYQVIEGKPSDTPEPPKDINGGMTLAIINVPPFPSYTATVFTTNVSSSYVSSSVINQNRAYTMKDIAKLDNRVKDLEYYTSLNLLEQETSSLKIVSDVTGANRFKNGIFVDNFSTTDNLDLDNAEFKASLSTSETAIVPLYTTDRINLNFANGSGVIANGSVIRLASNNSSFEVSLISQKLGTETIQCATSPYTYCGTIIISPKVDPVPIVCNRKWHLALALPRRKIFIPRIDFRIGSVIARLTGGFDINTLRAGQPLYWAIGGVGYSSFTVTITGPRGYKYTEILRNRNDLFGAPFVNRFEAGVWIPYTYPGRYLISVSKVLQGGFVTEEISNTYSTFCDITNVIPLSTPDTGRGIGRTIGTLSTILVADTDTVQIQPVTNNQIATVGNTATQGGLTYIPFNRDMRLNFRRNPFNLDLIELITGTANTTTSTTSTFKKVVSADLNTSITIPGIANNISLFFFFLIIFIKYIIF